ncbi:hypothetical protein UPYG_G00165340 [Umbra pygmaea]|uniref:Zona pellucida sperm-binding protein 1/4 Ig-like domain-containing protein n=1 Tax=Umbra pygmaea TaxID=75934 RepID=A0ABD0WMT4_UMBPY
MLWNYSILMYGTVTLTLSFVLSPCYGHSLDSNIPISKVKSSLDPTTSLSGRIVFGNSPNVKVRGAGFATTDHELAANDPIITQNGSLSFVANYQSGQHVTEKLPQLNAKLQRMLPSVQCSNDSMILRVKRGRTPHFLVDSGDGSPVLPLSRMPTHCGFSVKRSRRDVTFVAPYQGCHVTQQGGNYVLPLRLWGATLTMSCPVTPCHSPSVYCFSSGMVVKLPVPAYAVKVKVSGDWEQLVSACQLCGFTFKSFNGGVVITAPYKGPCMMIKANEHLLYLLSDEGEFTLSCPVASTSVKTMPEEAPGYPEEAPGYPEEAPGYPRGQEAPGYPRGQEAPGYPRGQEAPGYPRGQEAPGYPWFHHVPYYLSEYPSVPTTVSTKIPVLTNFHRPPSKTPHMQLTGYPHGQEGPEYPWFQQVPYLLSQYPSVLTAAPSLALTKTPEPNNSPRPTSRTTRMRPSGYFQGQQWSEYPMDLLKPGYPLFQQVPYFSPYDHEVVVPTVPTRILTIDTTLEPSTVPRPTEKASRVRHGGPRHQVVDPREYHYRFQPSRHYPLFDRSVTASTIDSPATVINQFQYKQPYRPSGQYPKDYSWNPYVSAPFN